MPVARSPDADQIRIRADGLPKSRDSDHGSEQPFERGGKSEHSAT